jgi:Asp-tRNA(Asn)/Glu-tRNA(Gln) amidotransferase A subunit family amidase
MPRTKPPKAKPSIASSELTDVTDVTTPTRLRGDWTETFLAALAKVPVVQRAAEKAGVTRMAVYHRMKADAKFRAAVEDAMEQGVDRVEDKGFEMALEGNESLIKFILSARRRAVYGKQQEVHHTGSVGLKVADVVATFERLGHDRQEVIAAMREAAALPEGEVIDVEGEVE